MQAFHLIELCHRSVSIPYFECEKHQMITGSRVGGGGEQPNNLCICSIPNFTMVIALEMTSIPPQAPKGPV